MCWCECRQTGMDLQLHGGCEQELIVRVRVVWSPVSAPDLGTHEEAIDPPAHAFDFTVYGVGELTGNPLVTVHVILQSGDMRSFALFDQIDENWRAMAIQEPPAPGSTSISGQSIGGPFN